MEAKPTHVENDGCDQEDDGGDPHRGRDRTPRAATKVTKRLGEARDRSSVTDLIGQTPGEGEHSERRHKRRHPKTRYQESRCQPDGQPSADTGKATRRWFRTRS